MYKTKAVFLDRDGVICENIDRPEGISSPRFLKEFHFTNNIKKYLQQLCDLNFNLFIVTNQPDIARRKMSYTILGMMHEIIGQYLPITAIRACLHDNNDNCQCRKPKPGMLLDLAKFYEIDLSHSYMIGDNITDMQAGKVVGCKTIFLADFTTGWVDITYDTDKYTDHIAYNMAEAVKIISGG